VPLDPLVSGLLSPVVLAFWLGVVATSVRSELRLPDGLTAGLSIYLLLAIGLKGGAELADESLAVVWRPALAAGIIGVGIPVLAYAVLRWRDRFGVADAAAIAAHYGSVSIVTFAACLAFLDAVTIPYEGFVTVLVALLEVPAIVVALGIAAARRPGTASWGSALREVVVGRGVFLLAGGVAIGFASGERGLMTVSPVFVDAFRGVLVLYMLDLGMVAARRLRDIRRAGAFLVGFAIVAPLVNGAAGVALGTLAGMSLGGSTVLGVLAASASYIAAPAAVRVSLPEANPSYYLGAALGVTFPFNLTIGIPFCLALARIIHPG